MYNYSAHHKLLSPVVTNTKMKAQQLLLCFVGTKISKPAVLCCRMVHSTDIVEFELRSKKFSLAVRKKEALVQPEPMYLPVQALLCIPTAVQLCQAYSSRQQSIASFLRTCQLVFDHILQQSICHVIG